MGKKRGKGSKSPMRPSYQPKDAPAIAPGPSADDIAQYLAQAKKESKSFIDFLLTALSKLESICSNVGVHPSVRTFHFQLKSAIQQEAAAMQGQQTPPASQPLFGPSSSSRVSINTQPQSQFPSQPQYLPQQPQPILKPSSVASPQHQAFQAPPQY